MAIVLGVQILRQRLGWQFLHPTGAQTRSAHEVDGHKSCRPRLSSCWLPVLGSRTRPPDLTWPSTRLARRSAERPDRGGTRLDRSCVDGRPERRLGERSLQPRASLSVTL